MAQLVKLKRTSVEGRKPTTSNIELGELAINTFDGKIYFEKDNGTPAILEVATEQSYYLYTSSLDSRYVNLTGNESIAGNKTFSNNVIISGDLSVEGTTTTIDSTTVNIGDNTLELNYGGSQTSGGILVKDATGSSTVSGSLLWDSSNDYWKLGKLDSESEVIVASNIVENLPTGTVSGSSQISLSGFNTSQLSENTNLYFTDTRVKTKLNTETVISGSSQISLSGFNTSQLSENTNLYYTDTRVKTKLDAESVLSGSNLDGMTVSGSFSGSFQGDGSQLTNITVSQTATIKTEFTNSSTWSVDHNLNTVNPLVQVYDANNFQIIPSSIELVSVNNATVIFESNQSGYVVVAQGGQTAALKVEEVTTVSDTFTNVTSKVVTHNFGTKNVIVTVYDENDSYFIPNSIVTTNTNAVTVTFTATESGRVVVAKAGHVVQGVASDANLLDGEDGTYYLNYGNFTSVPSGLVSGSDQIATTFAQTILDDGDAGTVRTTIGVDAAGTVNYTLPTNLAGDDIDIDTTPLTGATVISDLDINITTNTSGLVTDANGTVATRELTKGDIGLSNVENTTDLLKVVSTATQTALNLKANLAGPTFTGNTNAANLELSGYLRGPSSFVIDPAAHGNNSGSVIIAGNLQVDGEQTIVNSTTVNIGDKNIVLASGSANSAAANGAGITIDGAGASLTYSDSGTKFVLNKPLDVTGAASISGALTASNFAGSSEGANTGDQTSVTGNAGTVTNGVYTTGDQTIAGVKTFSGNVAISATPTTSKLNVRYNAGGTDAGESVIAANIGDDATLTSAIITARNAGNRGNIGNSAGSALFKAEFNDATAMIIDKDGNVGIGTDSPTSYDGESNDLVVASGVDGATPTPGITISCLGDTKATGRGALRFSDGTSSNEKYIGGVEYNHNGDSMSFRVGGTPKLTIASTGETTIKATSTSGLLLAQTGQSYYHNIRNQGDGLYIGADDGGQGGAGADMRFAVKGGEAMRISSGYTVEALDGSWSTMFDIATKLPTGSSATVTVSNIDGDGYGMATLNIMRDRVGNVSFAQIGVQPVAEYFNFQLSGTNMQVRPVISSNNTWTVQGNVVIITS